MTTKANVTLDVEAEFARIRREYGGLGDGAWASAKWYAEALVRSRAELERELAERTEERDAVLADLRKCEQQLIAVTPVTHPSHDWQPDGGVLRFESHPGCEDPHVHTTCAKCGARAWFPEHQWELLAKGCA